MCLAETRTGTTPMYELVPGALLAITFLLIGWITQDIPFLLILVLALACAWASFGAFPGSRIAWFGTLVLFAFAFLYALVRFI